MQTPKNRIGQSNPKPAKMDSSSTYFAIDVNAISFKKQLVKGKIQVQTALQVKKQQSFQPLL